MGKTGKLGYGKRRSSNLRLQGSIFCLSGRSSKCLLASVGVRRFVEYGGIGHSQGRNVSQSVQICRALPITDPKPFLASFFESGIVAFTFCTQGVGSFEAQTLSVNGAPVIRRNGLVFGAAPVFLSVVPIFVVTRTDGCLRLPEGTAEFLSEPTMSIRSFSILAHRQPSFANGIADCQFLWLFGASVVQRDHGFSLINIFHSVVEIAHIITFVRKKGTLPDGKDLVAGREDIFCGRSICHICRGRQFIKRQSGNAVYQHVAFVAPVKLIVALIVLIGGGMDAQGAVRVTAGMVFRIKFIRGKRFFPIFLQVVNHPAQEQEQTEVRQLQFPVHFSDPHNLQAM